MDPSRQIYPCWCSVVRCWKVSIRTTSRSTTRPNNSQSSLLVPTWFTHLFDGVENPNAGLRGFLDSITIVLSTPFLIAGVVAVLLNSILPSEQAEGANIVIHDRDAEMQRTDPTTGEQTSSHGDNDMDIKAKPAKSLD